MRLVLENRSLLSFLIGSWIGLALFMAFPFPVDDPVLQLVLAERPAIFYGFKWTYGAMLFYDSLRRARDPAVIHLHLRSLRFSYRPGPAATLS